MKKWIMISILVIVLMTMLTGCCDDTVQTCKISSMSYTTQSDLEAAIQPETLEVGEPVYASIQFIESPKGMEYTVNWYINDTEVKNESKTTINDRTDIVVYELESEQVTEGTLKIEIVYQDTVLDTRTVTIK